jgi:hypothetical protein
VADRATTARAEAAEGFAAVLSELRESVGSPSFRVMAGRSRVISHTTLHEAVKGNRLPSWGTTAEFIKACGADPMAYRERWEAANRAWSSAPVVSPEPYPSSRAASSTDRPQHRLRVDVPIDRSSETSDGTLGPAPPAPGTPGRRRRYVVLGGAAVGVLAVGGVVWSLAGRDEPAPVQPPGFVASDCPVRQPNPPAAGPAHEGDSAQFIADVTIPDCDHAHRGQTVTKIWRFRNAGTRPWVGYTLHRLDLPQGRDQCQTISDVRIPDTRPGEIVDVKTEVSVPNRPGFCFVRFKMMDGNGQVAFPGGRPVNFQLIVD